MTTHPPAHSSPPLRFFTALIPTPSPLPLLLLQVEWNDRGKLNEPARCPNPSCQAKFSMQMVYNRSAFLDKQLLKMQVRGCVALCVWFCVDVYVVVCLCVCGRGVGW